MKFTRRSFLQGASLSLASLSGFFPDVILAPNPSNQYGKILAQATPRKLALLIGINQYSQANSLHGCLTDVDLQRELLIHRFQFQPNDIVTLTNEQATRQGILTAFTEHLTKQVKENDVVVVHFSGYGRQIQLPLEETIANSLITYDSLVTDSADQPLNDILLNTLIGLCESLKTNKYTLVLDTSYQPTSLALVNKLGLRAYSPKNQQLPIISEPELSFQQQLQNQLRSKANYSQLSGLIISTTDNMATEVTSHNFNAGLFSYYLTQSLWQGLPQSNNLTIMQNVSSQLALATFNGEKINYIPPSKINLSPYYLPLLNNTKGDAIITKFTPPNNVELKLLGFPLFLLSNYHINSYLNAELEQNKQILVQLTSITGNKAKGIILNFDKNQPWEGLILRECLRVINRNAGLRIALDDSLEKIEKVDATSALSAIGNIESVANLGDNIADCILGKFQDHSHKIDSYSLFSITGVLLPNTTTKTPLEAVSTAVKRLSSSLKKILAEKLLHLTLNQNSSLLAVNLNLQINYNNKSFQIQKNTINSQFKQQTIKSNQLENNNKQLLINIPLGSELQVTINNNENQDDLYFLLLGINSTQGMEIYFSPDKNRITAGEAIIIPTHDNPLKWIVNSSKGIGELIVICAKSPFTKTLNTLYKNTNFNQDKEQIISLENPVMIAQSILEDLHGGNKNKNLVNNLNLSEVYALDVANWASFNFVYEIV
jgi:hypothetical protein